MRYSDDNDEVKDESGEEHDEEPLELDAEPVPTTRVKVRVGGSQRMNVQRRLYVTYAGLIAWGAFVIIWLFVYAGGYTLFENLGILISSFLILGGILGLLWVPGRAGPGGATWRIRVSIISGIGWAVFMLIWLPFYSYLINQYQNIAVVLIASVVLVLTNGLIWGSIAKLEIGKDLGWRPIGTLAIVAVWLLFIIVWLWISANLYTGYQNIAVTIVSLVIGGLVIAGIWNPWAQSRKKDYDIKGLGIGTIWLLLMAAWFWILADSFNIYQNIAVVIVSIIVITVLGALEGQRQWNLKDFDFTD